MSRASTPVTVAYLSQEKTPQHVASFLRLHIKYTSKGQDLPPFSILSSILSTVLIFLLHAINDIPVVLTLMLSTFELDSVLLLVFTNGGGGGCAAGAAAMQMCILYKAFLSHVVHKIPKPGA